MNSLAKSILGGSILATALLAQLAMGGAAQDNTRSKAAVTAVREAPDIPIATRVPEAAPLSINEATAKQMEGPQYARLFGIKANSPMYVAFPSITVRNQTDRRITSFELALKNNETGRGREVWYMKTRLEPGGVMTIPPYRWIVPEKRVRATSEGDILAPKPFDVDSEQMWSAGSASSLAVGLVSVGFEDGTNWSAQRVFDEQGKSHLPPSSGDMPVSVARSGTVGLTYRLATTAAVATPYASYATTAASGPGSGRSHTVTPGAALLQCVCSCGVDCSGGSSVCTVDCGSCGSPCQSCTGSCCVAAIKVEPLCS